MFEWLHQHKSGRLIETEVCLVRLPAEGQRPARASIIDDTERRRRARIQHATEIFEAVHTRDSPGLRPSRHRQDTDVGGKLYIAWWIGRLALLSRRGDAHERSIAPLPIDKGWTGYVLRSGKPLLAGPHNAVAADGLTVLAEGGERVEAMDCGAPPASIWLGAPLTIRGRTTGVVVVQDYQDPLAYGEEDKRILAFVGGQIAQPSNASAPSRLA